MVSQFGRALAFACSLLAFPLFAHEIAGNARADDKVKISVEAVINAWKNREARVRTFDFRVTGTEFKRAVTLPEQAIIMDGQVPHGPLSLPDVTTRVTMRLVADSNRRARLDHNSTHWSVEKKGYVP